MLNKATFFAYIRRSPFGGRLTQQQVNGIESLLLACSSEGVKDSWHIAYILATVFHETGARMVPVREGFAKSDKDAKRILNNRKYAASGYYGRGHVQITWKTNYKRMGERLGVNLVDNPDLALEPYISARICVLGMKEGLFTGKKLSSYFTASKNDMIGARAIVNGKDKAQLIASYCKAFYDALNANEDTKDDEATPDGADLSTDKTTIGGVATTVGTGLASAGVFSGIDNGYALAAICFAVVVAAVGAYLFFSGRIDLKKRGGV